MTKTSAPRRRLPALCAALTLVVAACKPDPTPVETGSPTTLPEGVPPPTVPTTSPGVAPSSTTAATAAPPKVTAEVRTVPLGASFVVAVGETVAIAGERLTVGYRQVLSDSRCPLDVQCITAGNAAIAITLSREGRPPATVTLNTTEGPTSAEYLTYTLELVDLSRGPSPAARLRTR